MTWAVYAEANSSGALTASAVILRTRIYFLLMMYCGALMYALTGTPGRPFRLQLLHPLGQRGACTTSPNFAASASRTRFINSACIDGLGDSEFPAKDERQKSP